MELDGLVSFIDDKIFGNEESFRDQFCKRTDGLAAFAPLKARPLLSRMGLAPYPITIHACMRVSPR